MDGKVVLITNNVKERLSNNNTNIHVGHIMSLGNHGKNIANLVYPEPNNLVELYTGSVEKFPNNTVIGERDAIDTFQWTTYQEFGKRIDNLRSGMASLQIIQPGDKIGIIANNRLEWAIGAFATFRLRACWVPM